MITCPRCGEQNPQRARFCLACGASLHEATSGEERKNVSVLFVDLVGFTATADQADPEDVRATLRPYHARVSAEIERFGGTVEKFVGDAVMAVFGAPVAHEDDPERSVRAGLRILESITELNEQERLDLAVRAAVATGEAVVQLGATSGTGEGIATGDVVNTAARLQAQAPVGSLVVNEQTYRATHSAVLYETLPQVAVKGKAQPVSLWRALEARSRFGVDVEAAKTPFVGRDRETKLLEDTFERMIATSEIQLVTVTGEPGVGKTRLLAELRAWIDDRPELVLWRQGRCLPYGDGITFWALGEIVKAQAGILESDTPQDADDKLRLAVAGTEDPEWLRARLRPLVGLSADGEATREESFSAWLQFLESVASTGPLVLLFEDLHWADAALLDFVERLVEWAAGLPILVLCTGRPELYELHPSWGGGKRNATTVALSPLSHEETSRLIGALLDAVRLPTATQAALLERAGGNPLYAEEYARLFLELGSAEHMPLPDSVQGIIAARLDTLSPDRKALIQDAAVVGKVFWAGALAAMAGREATTVDAGMQVLARKELVRRARRSSVDGQQEYAFWHALIRDVAYGQIPRAARATKHLAAANWIETMAGDRAIDHSELLAHHATEALAISEATGEDAGSELSQRAAGYLVLAGDRAAPLDAAAAHRRYSAAVALMDPGSDGQSLALMKLCESAQDLGRFEEASQHAESAAAAFDSSGDARNAARAYSQLAGTYFQLGGPDRMRAALDRALALLEPLAPGPEHVEAYTRMATVEAFSGTSDELSLGWAERAVALGEQLGLRREIVRAYSWRGLMRCGVGDLAGIEDLEHSLAEALELRMGFTVGAYVNLADQVWRQRGPEPALRLLREGIDWGTSRGGSPTWPMGESCWMLYDLGRWDELLSIAGEVRRAEEEHGAAQPGAMAMAYSGLVLGHRGDRQRAEATASEGLETATRIEDPQVLGPALVAAALVADGRGDSTLALAHLARFKHVTRNRPWFRVQCLSDAVRIACAAGDLELAEALVENVRTEAERDRLSALTARATISRARGNNAVAMYRQAAEGWERLGCSLEQALALDAIGDRLAANEIRARLGMPVSDRPPNGS